MKFSENNSKEAFGIRILKSNHSAIRHLRQQHDPAIHGNKFWNSSLLIMDFLQTHPPESKLRVLEVGCGWGLLSVFCAHHFNATCTGIDADAAVLPYAHLHADINQVEITTIKSKFEQLTTQFLSNFDLIVGADICFWDELTKPLYNLARRAEKAGVKQLIYADPGRSPFYELEQMCLNSFNTRIIEWDVAEPSRATGDLIVINY